MTAKAVTRARVLRRLAKYRHLLWLPTLVVSTAVLHRAYGMAFASTGGGVTILIDDQQPITDEFLDRVLLHELAHAETWAKHGTLRHCAHWKAACRRLSRATGLSVT